MTTLNDIKCVCVFEREREREIKNRISFVLVSYLCIVLSMSIKNNINLLNKVWRLKFVQEKVYFEAISGTRICVCPRTRRVKLQFLLVESLILAAKPRI